MSDSKLRELERRWKETGSVEDEAAYLLERVRVGDLTRERLELAAYWGHRSARVATCGVEIAPDPCEPGTEPEHWEATSAFLVKAGPEYAVGAGLSAAELALPVWEGISSNRQPRVEVDAVRVWLAGATNADATFDAAYAGSLDDVALNQFGPRAAAAAYAASLLLAFTESGAALTPPRFDSELLAQSLAWASYATSSPRVMDAVRHSVAERAIYRGFVDMKRAGITPST